MTHAEKFSDVVVNQETRAILPIQESLDKFRGLVTRTGKTNGAASVCLSRARGESPGVNSPPFPRGRVGVPADAAAAAAV